MVWVSFVCAGCRKCLFMGGGPAFCPFIFTYQKVSNGKKISVRNCVTHGICVRLVNGIICRGFQKNVDFQIQKCYIIEKEQPPTKWLASQVDYNKPT